MPSLSPSTYYHYYPFGTTDIITSRSICSVLASILIQSLIILILWMIVNYGLNELLVHESSIYVAYHLHLVGQLYWLFIPHTLFLYILLTMLFEPLSLHQHCRYYITITCVWMFCLTFASNAIAPSVSERLHCHVLLFCKLICNKTYRLKQTRKSDLHFNLLSSEIMSEMNVMDQTELHNKFLSDNDVQQTKRSTSNCCIRLYKHCTLCYLNLYSSHKFLLLLVLLNVSLFICFIVPALLHSLSKHAIAQDHYVVFMIVWCFICYILKSWMKRVGKHVDMVRLDIKLKYCADTAIKKQIYDLTQRMSTRSLPHMPQCITYEFTNNTNISSPDTNDYVSDSDIQKAVNEFKFDISFEVAMEIFIQIIFYSFYRDFSFILCIPNCSSFLIFKAIDLSIIFIVYWIRVLPSYYTFTLSMGIISDTPMDGSPYVTDAPLAIMISPDPGSMLKDQSMSPIGPTPKKSVTPFTPLSPMISIDESKSLHLTNDMRQASDIYGDHDTVHINAVDNIYGHMDAYVDHNTDTNVMISDEAYYDWRNRICVDVVIRCIVMIITALMSYGSLIVYYITDNNEVLPNGFDAKQLRISTYYFIISIGSELLLFGLLYAFVAIKYSFNMFQPFARLYAKSTHAHHYVLLFVVCSAWRL
eukprot:963949_1